MVLNDRAYRDREIWYFATLLFVTIIMVGSKSSEVLCVGGIVMRDNIGCFFDTDR